MREVAGSAFDIGVGEEIFLGMVGMVVEVAFRAEDAFLGRQESAVIGGMGVVAVEAGLGVIEDMMISVGFIVDDTSVTF